MNMKLKFFIAGMAIVAGLASAVSCQDLSKDLTALQNKVNSLEATVQGLQAKIEGGAVITSVTPTNSGIVIVLSTGNKYEITNGTNGKDGTPGTVVTIGDNGNWFIDGVDTGLKAAGKDGKDGKDGIDGKDGKDGKDGQDGKDGIDGEDGDSVVWKIEDGKFVEYKNGEATGNTESFLSEGIVTAVWDTAEGTLKLYGVEGGTGDNKEVVINLLSTLKSLAFNAYNPYGTTTGAAPTVGVGTYDNGIPVAQFYQLQGYYPKATLPFTAYRASNKPIFSYRVNPANADVSEVEFEYLSKKAITTRAIGDGQFFNFLGVKESNNVLNIDPEDGEIFTAMQVKHGTRDNIVDWPTVLSAAADGADRTDDLVALKATTAEGEEIVSDYAIAIGTNLNFADYVLYNKKDKKSAATVAPAATAAPNILLYQVGAGAINNKWKKTDTPAAQAITDAYVKGYVAIANPANVELPYDQSIDLDDYLETWVTPVGKPLPQIYVDATYTVKLVDEYIGADNITNQQVFVNYDEDTKIVSVKPEYGTAAINRTPVFKVQVTYEGLILAEGFLKLGITAGPALEPKTFDTYTTTVAYEKIGATKAVPNPPYGVQNTENFKYSWDLFNQKVLNPLGLSYAQFIANYNLGSVDIEFYKEAATTATATATVANNGVANGYVGPDNATVCITATPSFNATTPTVNTTLLTVTVNDNIAENTYGRVKFIIKALDNHLYPDVIIENNFSVTHNHTWWPLNPDYLIGSVANKETTARETVQVKGRLVGANWAMVSAISEHHKNYFTGYTQEGNHNALTYQLPDFCKAESRWLTVAKPETNAAHNTAANRIPQTVTNATEMPVSASLSGTTQNDDIQLNDFLIGDSYLFTMLEYQQLDNGQYCERLYNVKFVNPFTMVLPDIVLPTTNLPSTYNLQVIAPAPTATSVESGASIKIKESTPAGKLVWENAVTLSQAIVDEILATRATYGGLTFQNWTYALVFDTTGEDVAASFGNHLTISPAGMVTWNNGGTSLVRDKVAHYKVTVEILSGPNKICKLTATGKITCQKNI